MSIKTICAEIGALAMIGGLAACGSAGGSAAPAVTVHVTQMVTAKPVPATHSAKPKLVHTPATGPAPAPAQAAALPTVATEWAIDPPQFAVEPSAIGLSADGNGDLTGITWSSWTAYSAEGSGSINLDNGVPNMAMGIVVNVPVSITLSAPVNGSFTAMTVTDHAGNVNTYSRSGSGSDTYGLGVDVASVPCTTIPGYNPGGLPGHRDRTGFCWPDGSDGQM